MVKDNLFHFMPISTYAVFHKNSNSISQELPVYLRLRLYTLQKLLYYKMQYTHDQKARHLLFIVV